MISYYNYYIYCIILYSQIQMSQAVLPQRAPLHMGEEKDSAAVCLKFWSWQALQSIKSKWAKGQTGNPTCARLVVAQCRIICRAEASCGGIWNREQSVRRQQCQKNLEPNPSFLQNVWSAWSACTRYRTTFLISSFCCKIDSTFSRARNRLHRHNK